MVTRKMSGADGFDGAVERATDETPDRKRDTTTSRGFTGSISVAQHNRLQYALYLPANLMGISVAPMNSVCVSRTARRKRYSPGDIGNSARNGIPCCK